MAAMTGVTCHKDCLNAFEALKKKSAYGGLEFYIKGGKQIVIRKEFPRGAKWEVLQSRLRKDEGRYFVWDYRYTSGGVSKSKILFITWNPESGAPKEKMMYAGSKDAIKKQIAGGVIEIQANYKEDLVEKDILARCKKGF